MNEFFFSPSVTNTHCCSEVFGLVITAIVFSNNSKTDAL